MKIVNLMIGLKDKINQNYRNHIRYIIILIVTGVIAIVFGLISGNYNDKYRYSHSYKVADESLKEIGFICEGVSIIFSLIAITALIKQFVAFCKFLHGCWETIQDDGYAITTPNKAVSFLFIPIFNFYWIFIAYYGLARQVNEYIDRHKLDDRKKIKKGQTLTFCILTIGAVVVPFIGWFILTIISIFLYFMIIANFRQSCAFIADNKTV